jgi:hypothetical protein
MAGRAVDALRNCARRTRMQRWSRGARRRTLRASRTRAAERACRTTGSGDPDSKERRPTTESAAAAVAPRALPDSSEATVAQDAKEELGKVHCVAIGGQHAESKAEASITPEARASAEARRPCRVHFSEAPDTLIEVTPYSEVYGIHPRLFVFDRKYYMVPSGGQFGFVDLLAAAEVEKTLEVDEASCESDGDDSDDGEWEPPVMLHFC